jgi:hypothetical protein
MFKLNFPTKSNIVQFGEPILENPQFLLSNSLIEFVDKITYLGVKINNKLDFDTSSMENFKNVSKSIFSLSYLGLTPNGLNPQLKSFI